MDVFINSLSQKMKMLLQLFLFLTLFAQIHSYCPPLIAPETTELTCEEPLKRQRVDCFASWLPKGAVAYFQCLTGVKRLAKGRIVCSEDGIHRDLRNTGLRNSSRDHLPCGIKWDANRQDIHFYGFRPPDHYDLTEEDSLDFKLLGEALHNKFRRSHGSPPLELQENLSQLAQDWADHISRTGRLDMAPNLLFGQNVFLAQTNNLTSAVNDAIQNWYYKGRSEYCWEDVTENWSNSLSLDFSQLIWANSKLLGIGVATLKSRNKTTAIVAFYDPPGNTVIDGDEESSERLFELNVLPLQANNTE